jgi:hypothetical protein
MTQIIVHAKWPQRAPATGMPEIIIDKADIARRIAEAEIPVTITVLIPPVTINGIPVTWGTEAK